MSDAQRERELKFAVPDGFVVPELRDLLPRDGSVAEDTVVLESTYFDTVTRDLLSSGVTLRRRTGDTDEGWHLKIPAGKARTEIRVGLGGRGVPAEIRELTGGLRGRAALRPIATLRTERHLHRLLDADGSEQAEVADDHVVSHTQREFAITRSWREVEVELAGGTEKLLARVRSALTDAGATDATVGSKLLHALDVAGLPEPDLERLSGVVARYLGKQFAALVRGDVELRRGSDVVHATRVATRRYRSVLRVFSDALDAGRAERLDAELKWYATQLGELRDAQVLRKHLDGAVDDLPAHIAGTAKRRIDVALDAHEAAAQEALGTLMGGSRYTALMRELRSWREQLPMREDGAASDVRRYVRKAKKTLDKRLAAARSDHGAVGDESHHRARKAAKRARYVAELSRPVLNKKAEKSVKRAKALQTRFGDRQDNVLAAQFLRRLAGDDAGFALGVLYQRERDHGDAIE